MNLKGMAGAAGTVLLFGINILLGIAQILAIFSGVQYWLDWHWFFSSLIAGVLVFVLRINLLNCVIGMLGAHYAWHWSWPAAAALFFGLFLVMIVISLSAGAASKVMRW